MQKRMERWIAIGATLFFFVGCDSPHGGGRNRSFHDIAEESYARQRSVDEAKRQELEATLDLGDKTASMLSEGLAFYQPGKSTTECERDYRECRSKARMATATMPDYLVQKLQEYSLARDAMMAAGYKQLPIKDLPAGTETTALDGISLAGSRPTRSVPTMR